LLASRTTTTTTNVGEDAEKKEPSYAAGGNISSYNYDGMQD
jgi:hypothetical protein